MSNFEARKVLAILFKNGIFKSGFREAVSGSTSGKVKDSFIFLSSSKFSEEELLQRIQKQRPF